MRVTRLEIFVMRLPSFVTRLGIPVARLAIRVTRLRSRVTKIPARITRLASRAAPRDPPQTGHPNVPLRRAVYTFYERDMVESLWSTCNHIPRRISSPNRIVTFRVSVASSPRLECRKSCGRAEQEAQQS